MGANSVLNLSGDVKVKDLIDASFSNTRSSTINILSGTTTAEKRIWLHQDSELNISKGASLVASGFTYSGNNADKAGSISAIGTQEIELVDSDRGSAWGHNTNKVNTLLSDLDVEYSAASESILNANLSNVALSTKEGAGKLTLAREGGVSLNSLTANSDVELSTKTTVTGTTTVAGGSTVTVSGAGSSLQGLSGAGTLTASGGATTEVRDASGFTGTLTATDGALQIRKASSLAAINSSSVGGIWLQDSASSSVTVGEIVLAGSMVGVYYTIPADPDTGSTASVVEATVSTGSLTVSGDSTLYANLELKANGTLQLDSALAMGSTLTLNSGITLANTGYVHISDIAKNTPITLFSSVNGVTYYDIDNQAQTLADGDSIDAGLVFGNINQNNRDFDLKFSGGNVLLVANNDVPETTTATLSLLALMGLAARRRRKAAK